MIAVKSKFENSQFDNFISENSIYKKLINEEYMCSIITEFISKEDSLISMPPNLELVVM